MDTGAKLVKMVGSPIVKILMSESDSKEFENSIEEFRTKKHVINFFDNIYDNTSFGKVLKKNSSDFEEKRTIGNWCGYALTAFAAAKIIIASLAASSTAVGVTIDGIFYGGEVVGTGTVGTELAAVGTTGLATTGTTGLAAIGTTGLSKLVVGGSFFTKLSPIVEWVTAGVAAYCTNVALKWFAEKDKESKECVESSSNNNLNDNNSVVANALMNDMDTNNVTGDANSVKLANQTNLIDDTDSGSNSNNQTNLIDNTDSDSNSNNSSDKKQTLKNNNEDFVTMVVGKWGEDINNDKKPTTLWQISKLTGVSVEELAEYNNIKDPNLIYEGDIIKVPKKKNIINIKTNIDDKEELI